MEEPQLRSMEKYQSNWGRHRHWVYFAIFAMLLSVIAAFNLQESYDARISEARQKSLVLATSGRAIIDQLVRQIDAFLPGIHDVIELSQQHPESFDRQVTDVLFDRMKNHPYLMDLLVVDDRGNIRQWTGKGEPPSVLDRDYVTIHLKEPVDREYFLSQPKLSKVHDDKWFFAFSRAYREESGSISHILVAIVDLAYVRSLLNSLELHPDGTYVLGSDSGYIYARIPDHEAMVGRYVKQVKPFLQDGLQTETVVATSSLDGKKRVISYQRSDISDFVFVGSLSLDTELSRWYRHAYQVVGLVACMLVAAGSLTYRLIASHRRLAHLSSHDSLSGLFNRRAFRTMSIREIDRVGRYPEPLSVMMLDLDDFKKLNDQHGHQAGDRAISTVGRVFDNHLRRTDLACRYGGEEFAVLLPKTDMDGAGELAEKIRHALETSGEREVTFTASIGVAEMRRDEGLDSLLCRSDQALYQAKASGKNRVCFTDVVGTV